MILERLDSYEAVANVHGSSMKPQAITVAPLKRYMTMIYFLNIYILLNF